MSFVLLGAVIWAIAVAVWWVASRTSRNADAERLKQRALGLSKRSSISRQPGSSAPTLLRTHDTAKGLWIGRLLDRLELRHRLALLLEQAGLRWNAARLVHLSLGLFLAAFTFFWMLLPPAYRIAALLPAAAVAGMPLIYVLRVRGKRLYAFEELFPDSLEFMARSMRAGHAFSVSLEMIHKEFQEPLSGEFRRAFEEHNLGLPLDAALLKLSSRVPSLDVHFFVSAVILQKRTGGNLAEILDKLAFLIRERFKLRGRIRAISAHGRMTGMALTSIPVAVAAIMFLVNPDYVTFFGTDEIGNYMAAGAIGLQLLGYAVIKKIVNIEV